MARPDNIHTPARDKLDELGIDSICECIAEGSTLRDMAVLADVGIGSVMRYCEKPEHLEQYVRAMAVRADVMAEAMLDIADDGLNDTYKDENGNVRVDHDVIARSRLRVDARKWYLSKLAPKKYGDKLTNEHTGPDGGAVVIESIKREIIRPE